MTTIDSPASSEAHLLASLDRLDPQVRALADEMNAARHLPDSLVQELTSDGFFRMFVPEALGGLEMSPLSAAAVVEQAARIDGSFGWCIMVGAQSAWYPAFLPEAAAREVLGDQGARVAGALRPGGKAMPVEGGYRVSGRWSFVSGSTYATWLYGTCIVENPDRPPTEPELRVVYVPARGATILDTWNSVGLRATGSNDFVLDDTFVPAERTLPFPELDRGVFGGPLYRDGVQNFVYTSQAAHALGVATAAFDSFLDIAARKMRWLSMSVLREQATVRTQAAEAHVVIQTAKSWLREAAGAVWQTCSSGDRPTLDQRVALRMAITHGINSAVRAGDLLHAAAGAAVIAEDHPLQRQFQDLRAAGAHVQATPRLMENAGAYLLGAETDGRMLAV